jgi:hypothetical protein
MLIYFVGRSRVIFANESRISHEAFTRKLTRCLERNGAVVVDEAQRLPKGVFQPSS